MTEVHKVADHALPNITVERLFLYRRVLRDAMTDGKSHIFSHELAAISGATSEQVRRDLMLAGVEGNRRTGYDCKRMFDELNAFFKMETVTEMVIVGAGHLGRALVSFFSERRAEFHLEALFDVDGSAANQDVLGQHCYLLADMEKVLKGKRVHVGILAVQPDIAQSVAERLVEVGAWTILNLAPIRLQLPSHVQVENLDVVLAVKKLGFFAKTFQE